MNTVAKNLKTIRTQAGYTQDDLAQALYVTRQTVSSWETGRNEPDIATLTSMAEFLQVDVTELIYGPARPVYQVMQKKYKLWSIVLGAVALLGFVSYLWLRPRLMILRTRNYDIRPLMVYQLTLIPICFAAAGALLPCLISLARNTSLNKPLRFISLALGIALIAPDLCTALQFAMWDLGESSTLYPWFPFVVSSPHWVDTWAHAVPFISGIAIFLGLNRSSEKNL